MKRIGFHGVPRSGTTWVGNIFNSNPYVTYKHQPLYSYAFKDFLNNSSKKEDILRFFQQISESTDDYTNQKDLIKDGLVPNFTKLDDKSIVVYKEARYHHIIETLLREDDEFMFAGIIRNPISTIWSWKNTPNEFKKEWDFEKEWRYGNLKNEGLVENFYGYEKWKEAANIFEKVSELYPNRVHIMNYSEFLSDPYLETNRMFDKLGIRIHPQVMDFLNISNSESKGPYSVFRKKELDGDWIDNIGDDIINFIYDDLKDSELEKYLQI